MTARLVTGATIAATDGGDTASAAADWAADRAQRSESPMALVRVVEPIRHELATDVDRRVAAERADVQVECARLRACHPTLDLTTDVVYGDPGEILRQMSSSANLLVIGSSSRRRHESFVVDRLVATTNGPVAVIPAVPASTAEIARHGIVVGVDGTDASLAALAFAAAEAARSGEPLDVVHAWLDSRIIAKADAARASDDAARTALLRSQHEALLRDSVTAVTREHPTLAVRERVVQGDAATVLLDAASGRRMLVVGINGRSRIARFLLGSVSRAIVRAAAVPTVVVRGDTGEEAPAHVEAASSAPGQ
ncbi:universal stress protein [Marisediminicola senii]|uniref:universal stress protein n=1 Tax=Marisediminicola senii TaxID=2711233 RepID=UPI0013ECF2AB|nr:universal stress protein [Marisediminicola senii]